MADRRPSYDTNRTKLKDVIPLSGPFGMYIEPTRNCELKCFYCMHATRGDPSGELAKTGFKMAHMEMDAYKKIVKDIMSFPTTPKRITFSGLGEPLMNPRLCEMIQFLRSAGFKERCDVLTNAVSLTSAQADELVSSGVNRIQISVQGLTGEAYKKVAGVYVDIERYIKAISYLYKRKGECEIFIKIIDSNLEKPSDEALFYEMFEPVCDSIHIEHLVVMEHQMGDLGGKVDRSLNLNREPFVPREVCGIMFYFLQVNVDGDVYPCSTPGLPTAFSLGNVKEKTLSEIWNGHKRNRLLRGNLVNGYRAFPPCRECSSVVCITDPAEYLDDCREEMLMKIPEIVEL